jgi:hypothetical protein
VYRLLIAMGMAATVFLAVGCGGSDSETSSLTKAQFIKQADQICADVAKKRQAAVNAFEADMPQGVKASAAYLDQNLKEVVAPSLRREAERLEALPVPEGDEAKVQSIVDRLLKASTALEKGGAEGIAKAGFPEFEQEAAAYGLKICPNPNPQ